MRANVRDPVSKLDREPCHVQRHLLSVFGVKCRVSASWTSIKPVIRHQPGQTTQKLSSHSLKREGREAPLRFPTSRHHRTGCPVTALGREEKFKVATYRGSPSLSGATASTSRLTSSASLRPRASRRPSASTNPSLALPPFGLSCGQCSLWQWMRARACSQLSQMTAATR